MPQQDMITRSATHRALERDEISPAYTTRRRPPRSCRGQGRLRYRRTVPDTTRMIAHWRRVPPCTHS